jgi:hypothetical protein
MSTRSNDRAMTGMAATANPAMPAAALDLGLLLLIRP